MKTRITRSIVSAASAFAVCILAAAVARAQAPSSPGAPPEGVNVDVTECLELETREQQIACYLARVDEAVEASEASAAGNPASQASEARAAQAEPGPPAPARQASQPPVAQPQPVAQPAEATRAAPAVEAVEEEMIVATITGLRELQPDVYVIDLDNGQVWRQSSPKRYFLREGAEVHLVPSRWGVSYRLTDPNVGNFIQVERVR